MATGPGAKVVGSCSVVVLAAATVLGCSGGGKESDNAAGSDGLSTRTPAASAATATPTPTLDEEILAAYFRYWEAYSAALLNLDASLAEGVAAGEELQRIREEVNMLRSQGVALRVVMQHRPVLVQMSANSARLLDEMVNNSFYVDPVTKNPPVASGSGEILRDTFHLEKRDGRWVVILSTRQRQGR